MKNLLLLNLLFILSITCFAQSKNRAVIYLKNGSIIHGTIVKQTPDSIIKIETKDGDVFVYKYSEIEKITPVSTYHTPINPSRQVVHHPIVDTSKWSGLFVSPQLFAGSNISYNNFGSLIIIGHQINKRLFLGGGVGFNKIISDSMYKKYDYIIRDNRDVLD